ncbi:MAG: hypothetical protein LC102_12870 [Ignavibacteriales bacterium]|nr:MAG: hypothetical protein F9K26_00270 [Ignavibacteriaceae bacterium]MBW7871846.1 hypothetical protein [Ignavibacteria bacterium]MCZ2144304.1 hypothetical protein [Ignavibacteriales bacterium]OQY73129.1 MAG: hypothetical protein B6D45_08360 [Ignavibacteriales bacterium UTCHB3]MBV6446257.1 hypothetical protein [Ignavibacteriaceae bacterium]
MTKFIISAGCFLTCAFLFNACTKPDPVYKIEKTSGKKIIALFDAYINGEERAENQLRDPFEFNILDAKYYRKAEIDSITSDGQTFYALLLQHKNSGYNKLLIYDDTLGLLLHDKNLPGSLLLKKIFINNKEFFSVVEKFSVESVVNVEKLKIYGTGKGKATLHFDNFTVVSSPSFLAEMTVSSAKNSPLTLSFSVYGNKKAFKPVKVNYSDENDSLSPNLTEWNDFITKYLKEFQFKGDVVPIAEDAPKYYNSKFDRLCIYLPGSMKTKNGVQIKSLFSNKVAGTVASDTSSGLSVYIFDLLKNSPIRVYIKDISFNLLSDEFNYSVFASEPKKSEEKITLFVLVRSEDKESLVVITCSESYYKKNYALVNYIINSVSFSTL